MMHDIMIHELTESKMNSSRGLPDHCNIVSLSMMMYRPEPAASGSKQSTCNAA